MRAVLDVVVDGGKWFEVQAGYGPAIICALAHLGGDPVVIVANQPKVMAGSIDAAAADKAAHIILVADSFHLPLIFLADNPGVLPGTQSERAGILRSGARMFAAQAQATTPKIHLTLRKAYGFGSMVMSMAAYGNQTATFSYPGATLGAMGAGAVEPRDALRRGGGRRAARGRAPGVVPLCESSRLRRDHRPARDAATRSSARSRSRWRGDRSRQRRRPASASRHERVPEVVMAPVHGPIHGRWYEELEVGLVVEHTLTRTVLDSDNVLFSTMTMNPSRLHLDAEYAANETEFGRPLVNSLFTLGLLVGLSVLETTHGTTVANLGFQEVVFPLPVFAGDTIHAETEVVAAHESRSRPDCGIVTFEHRGFNQRDELVCRARRDALMRKRPS